DDVFTRGGEVSSGDRIYRFIGRDGEVMALRPDFTALVAKVVSSRLARQELPLRLFYSGEVLRYQPPRAGRQEELFQIGLEHLGTGSVAADVEVILVAREALSRLGIDDAVFTLGHVGFALRLLSGIEDLGTRALALEALKRRDRDGLRRVVGAPALDLTDLSGGAEVIERARRAAGGCESLDRLEAIAAELSALGLEKEIRLDLSEVRDFDYYTGLVLEIHARGSGLELGGGGRYDSLLGRFGREMPAVGFYLSLDRASELLAKRGISSPDAAASTVRSLREALLARKSGERIVVKP
ncbi:MAG TPA: ATP phosphoribosyltransferase regulatory subunit, partial [Vicinamibacteria bacterium]